MTDLEFALNKIRNMSKLSCDIKDKAMILSETIDVYIDTLDSVYASLKNEKEKQNNPWIPVEDLLPETDKPVLVTYMDDSDETKVGWDYYMDGFWHASILRTVIAWMPMPEVYEP